ncbi:Lar family restriction alleviation protein [Roseovarius sp. MMSF_3281]|uniref:Lar family restriction alleviation protein n=1 Tax=Roseovarius sp. MMSF_3281 TaxID=3046694 RepID=UPI00273D5BBE|nr:Lar family restriction alleviation protein [Roseovarius sp. MMSF_3281]
MTDKMKSCPFCRNDGASEYSLNVCKVATRHVGWNYTVECTSCGTEGPYASSADRAITAWNTRANAEALKAADELAEDHKQTREEICELADFFLHSEGANKEDCAKVFADLQRARLRMDKTLAAYQATRGERE